jgi:hypothetical protein
MRQIVYLQKVKISIGSLNLGGEKLEAILHMYFLATALSRYVLGQKHMTISTETRNYTLSAHPAISTPFLPPCANECKNVYMNVIGNR